jgi:hypothetical protein
MEYILLLLLVLVLIFTINCSYDNTLPLTKEDFSYDNALPLFIETRIPNGLPKNVIDLENRIFNPVASNS